VEAVCTQKPVNVPPTDRELAEALARGDAGAVDAFYEAHVDAVYEFVFFRVGRLREEAEDVTSETFMTALRRIGSFEGRAPIGTWLRGIARNKCRERARLRARRRLRGDVSLDAWSLESLALLDERELPPHVLESAETAAAVTATLAQMPERYRGLLVGKYVDGLSFAEIAAQRGCSPKAAESMVQRAKVAFARVLRVVSGDMQTRAFHD
jgi:RNA polymerase sigma-70 factor (ECF subfamily)